MRFVFFGLVSFCGVLFSTQSFTQELQPAPFELHQAHCSGCHINITDGDGTVIYTRSSRLAVTEKELQRLVRHFADGAELNWTSTEIKAVSDYLNTTYYGFQK